MRKRLNDQHNRSEQDESPRQGNPSRRRVLTVGAGALAVSATQVPRTPAMAAEGDPMLVGAFNDSETSRTMLEGTVAGNSLLWLQNYSEADNSHGLTVVNRGKGFAIEGHGLAGAGVWGSSTDFDGVQAWSQTGNGVFASSGTGVAGNFTSADGRALQVDGASFFRHDVDSFIVGLDNPHTGSGANTIYATSHGSRPTIEGISHEPAVGASVGLHGASVTADGTATGAGVGVWGESGTGQGVAGTSDSGTALHGVSQSGAAVHGHGATGVGGHFSTDTGTALRVEGPASFSTAGSATLPRGATSVFVEDSRVTGNSHVSVTPVDDPGLRTIRWVERSPGSGFRVHVTQVLARQRTELPFTYLIVEATA